MSPRDGDNESLQPADNLGDMRVSSGHFDRQVWWGTCDYCGARFIVAPDMDTTDELPDQSEWESFSDCLVCGDGSIDWGGSDPEKVILR